jgi:antitoxin HicB
MVKKAPPPRVGARRRSRREAVRSTGYAYAAVFEPAEEGGYVVHFPALGVSTQGETLAEARAMAADLLRGHIAWLLDDGEAPPPSDVRRGIPRIEAIRVTLKAAA